MRRKTAGLTNKPGKAGAFDYPCLDTTGDALAMTGRSPKSGAGAKSLPVLIFHYISNHGCKLSMPPVLFEEHCRLLAENGWQGVGLEEAEAFLLHGEPLPVKSVLISLDDGYLDNYVYGWPILEKYGHKGVIFAVADAVSNGATLAGAHEKDILRPTLKDVWEGRLAESDLPPVHKPMRDSGLGYAVREDLFFNWEEARAMEASGTIRIGGHSLRHEVVFTGPEYSGFLQPRERGTAFSHKHSLPGALWGMPLFGNDAEFRGRAFIPSEELLEGIRNMVPQEEAQARQFFSAPENVKKLEEYAKSFKGRVGRLEALDEQKERLVRAMQANQAIFKKELNRQVKSFCWPWGHYSAAALEAGQAAGFEVFFTVGGGANPPCRPLHVYRFNAKLSPRESLKRVRLYSRPVLGELYRRFRF